MTDAGTITKSDLGQFTASEQFFRHGLSKSHIYTEGVQFVAERAGAYWLLDSVL